jgi:hypothetical protein
VNLAVGGRFEVVENREAVLTVARREHALAFQPVRFAHR